jgi:arginine decarboxylase
MKANQNREFILPLLTEGANMETGSVNELRLIQRMWEQKEFSSQLTVLCNGPKTPAYLALIAELQASGLDIVPIVEDLGEFELLQSFRGQIGIRVNLDTKVHSHWDKKFDRFGLTPQEILDLDRLKNFTILHYHLGSQMMDVDDILRALKDAMALYVKLQAKHPHLDTIDVGGGFAVNYGKTKMYTVRPLARRMIRYLRRASEAAGVRPPNVIVEWGRAVVGPGQVTIYQVVAAKPIPKGSAKYWYIIDGSFMNDLLDTWAIHQRWHVVPVIHADAKRFTRVWLAGMSCDSDDKYTAGGDAVRLPKLEDMEAGEKLSLAIFDTGAYQDALASHHCLLSSPAKVIAQNGEVKIIRPRETAEDVGKLFGW